jgi:hypothetical protein
MSLLGPSAQAADVSGKWYGRLDSQPVISISRTGAQYSASLDYPHSLREVVQGLQTFRESTDKSVGSFRVADGHVRFSIRSVSSIHGDTNFERDGYDLHLSEDGLQLTGIVTRVVNEESTDPLRMTRAPITLYLHD